MSYRMQQALIEDMNYYNDPRTRAASGGSWYSSFSEETMKATVEVSGDFSREDIAALGLPKPEDIYTPEDLEDYEDEDGIYYEDVEVEVSCIYEVCDLCGGKGRHVNPNIDASGYYPEDAEDAMRYRRGFYDIDCNSCKGRRVVPVIDTSTPLAKRVQAYLDDAAADRAAMHAEMMAELRMGC